MLSPRVFFNAMNDLTDNELNIKDYVRIIRKRLWLVLSFLLIIVTVVAIRTFSIVPVYEATAKIIIERDNPNILSFQEVMNIDASSSDYYVTQAGIIKSRSLARKVFAVSGMENT